MECQHALSSPGYDNFGKGGVLSTFSKENVMTDVHKEENCATLDMRETEGYREEHCTTLKKGSEKGTWGRGGLSP